MPVRLYDAGVPCGFPSPAQDYLEQRLSLDDICIRHPESTYLGFYAGTAEISVTPVL